jgi:hypothetical protein
MQESMNERKRVVRVDDDAAGVLLDMISLSLPDNIPHSASGTTRVAGADPSNYQLSCHTGVLNILSDNTGTL